MMQTLGTTCYLLIAAQMVEGGHVCQSGDAGQLEDEQA